MKSQFKATWAWCWVLLVFSLSPADAEVFQGSWDAMQDGRWVGDFCWANRLQDWEVQDGRLVCLRADSELPMRTVQHLTADLGEASAPFEVSVELGLQGETSQACGAAGGLLVGVGNGLMNRAAAAIVHHWSGPGAGLFVGVAADGSVFFHDNSESRRTGGNVAASLPDAVRLVLKGEPTGNKYRLTVACSDLDGGKALSQAERIVDAHEVLGNVALVSDPGSESPAAWWFSGWSMKGEKVDLHPESGLGAVLCTQYTLSRNVLKMTAQLMPVQESQAEVAVLETRQKGKWSALATAPIVRPGYTATFRVEEWPSSRDVDYRVVCKVADNTGGHKAHTWSGTVRHDPVDKDSIVVAGFTGNHNNSHILDGGTWGGFGRRSDWIEGMYFPHQDLTDRVAVHKPDVLFFSGDQVYENKSPTPPDPEHILDDYLYKWYLWCWAYRDMAKDIPCICIPDDHDVFQGNLWGAGGRKAERFTEGGYVFPAEFVKMVERTQTLHLPDPFFRGELEQGIGTYFTGMTYGRIGFAILEDRKFKSGCEGLDPELQDSRADHIYLPGADVSKLDRPGLKLLGDQQCSFLGEFVKDWRGQDMKMALSQTIFTGLNTHIGSPLRRLRIDLDTNGWPQTARNRALDLIRRGFMFHLAGDQHLASLSQYGVDAHGDAGWAFCVPSIVNFYPRAWVPDVPGENREPGMPSWLGEHEDGFLNKVTVYAVANPPGMGGELTGKKPANLHEKVPGYGIVRMNKRDRTITAECWPRHADPSNDEQQYPGWPRTIPEQDNYGRKVYGYLPTITVSGMKDPVVQLFDEQTGEMIYARRAVGSEVQLKVFSEGVYRVRIGDPGTGTWQTVESLLPGPMDSGRSVDVSLL